MLSDSPSLLRKLTAAASRAFSTASLPAACSCRFRQQIAVLAVHRLQSNHILAAQSGYRASQHGLAARTLADFARHFRCQTVSRKTSHQLQGLIHLALGNHREKRGLLELDGESLSQRVVEYRIASLVFEIGENNRVLICQRMCLTAMQEKRSSNERNSQDSR